MNLKPPGPVLGHFMMFFIVAGLVAIKFLDKFELGNIFSISKELKKIKMRNRQNNLTDENSVAIGVSGNKRTVYIPDNARHVFVCGTTGSGKTVALSNFIKRAVDKNYGLVIVDGKGDVGSGSILEMTRSLTNGRKKLYVVNLNVPMTSDKYNPFQNANPTIVKDMLINMTEWSEPHYKFNCERYLQRAIILLSKLNVKLSFSEIVKNISGTAFTKLSMELLKKNLIDKDYHLENLSIAELSGKIASGAVARFSTIVESELGTIFDESGVDIAKALNENAVILFVLNPLIYPEITPLIGRLILIDCKKAISGMFGSTERKFLVFDEIATYGGTALLDIVNKSRSAECTCILATQGLSDLDAGAEHFKEQIVENCNNYIVLRQNSSANADGWASILGTRPTMQMTFQVKKDGGTTTGTDLGSLRPSREFICHPDDIKGLQTGNAFMLSRDEDFYCKVKINKPI